MRVRVEGAREHNLRDVGAEFGDGLTVVTGVSGSGKTSLVFDTLYHESRRRFLDVFSVGSWGIRLSPADVRAIEGLGPAVAVGQDLLNRNPGSTLATASGMHPFLRLLYANFGDRECARCGTSITVLTEDEIVERVRGLARGGTVDVLAPIVRDSVGSHRTLLALLSAEFGPAALRADGNALRRKALDAGRAHRIDVRVARLTRATAVGPARRAVRDAFALGADAVALRRGQAETVLSRADVCTGCGEWLGDVRAVHFHQPCPHCDAAGCEHCAGSGLHPLAAGVRWSGLRFPELLALTVDEAVGLLASVENPGSARRLLDEVARRLDALQRVGLGYVGLDRPAPTLSRGESQRVRLAVSLTGQLEDLLHVLDEPTIGQHPADVARLMPVFRDLAGPVVYVEHDRIAAAAADRAVDLGPGAGADGGEVVFTGPPAQLWRASTVTGRYFSLREKVAVPEPRPAPTEFLTVRRASLRTLRDIDMPIPLGRLTVVTGVSGSGKSTLVEDVLVPSLAGKGPVGCDAIDGAEIRAVMVTQDPIGRNPRSNPATYTKLSDVIRDIFAAHTGLSASHFSFNRPEGACPECKGMGATEVHMRYLPSTWIPCAECGGSRFTDDVLAATIELGGRELSIADMLTLPVGEVGPLLLEDEAVSPKHRRAAERILRALLDIGLGYLQLGQPSPTLSGGEAQRVKLAKYLGRRSLAQNLLVLDEPSTGLHPSDVAGLLKVLDRLVRSGATIVVVEHNTDVIRAADWVIDLGPGAGPAGGGVLYAGPPAGLRECEASLTNRALADEESVRPRRARSRKGFRRAPAITVRGARVHNLRNVAVDFPKGKLTVVTGVSGSGKSSLVEDVLGTEARRRFLETLSMYERQGVREGPEADVDSVAGLGVALRVASGRMVHARRATVGTATELSHHMAVLLARLGERECTECGGAMLRGKRWRCPSCGAEARLAEPRHFSSSTYFAACRTCHGIGTLQEPNPAKLIVHPEKPLCGGAMYSPGFFPRGYLCKPPNGGYFVVQALARRHGFDPATTPWNEMSEEARSAFLFGESEPLEVRHESRDGSTHTYRQRFGGFYGWVRDWDAHGTYTDSVVCPDCAGGRLRREFTVVRLAGHNMPEFGTMALGDLADVLDGLQYPEDEAELAGAALETARKRLGFLRQVGLGYLNLERPTGTLSAGEAQRIRLAGLLGSGLTSLTVLVDEPTRGLHPCEVEALAGALIELRDEGNTVIVVEHDPLVIRAADHVIDMGPGAGAQGGAVVASGTPAEVIASDTATGRWMRGEGHPDLRKLRRRQKGLLAVRGPRENNLKGEDVGIPLGLLVGICGVSGSGKSTLVVDTLGRALAPRKHTTSLASEPFVPGAHDSIEGAPGRTIVIDQARAGVVSPASYLGVDGVLRDLYAQGADARLLGLAEKDLKRGCSACGGRGAVRFEMTFLPDVWAACDTCSGTGFRQEARDVKLRGIALPDVFGMTIDEVLTAFEDEPRITRPLTAAHDVGLGYLVLRQPAWALSGGEAQRLKIARELARKAPAETLYILDEPTVGQHLEDVARLLAVLRLLVDDGHSVLVVEHHAHLLAACDWLIELGPVGGPEGGYVVAEGPPDKVASGETPTARYLRQVMEAYR